MKTLIVLAMHGAPPNDYPKRELCEFFSLHNRIEHASPSERAAMKPRFAELDQKIRAWTRTAQYNPYWAGSHDIATHLARATEREVIIGFNEFCAPTLDTAFEQAITRGAEKIIVLTPMMTRGGEHSEIEIPEAIAHAQAHHPQIKFQYNWPLAVNGIAQFLASQITAHNQ